MLLAFFDALSAETRFMRFMEELKELSPALVARFTADRLRPRDGADRHHHHGRRRRADGGQRPLFPRRRRRSVEFALVVADDWQRHGLGRRLMGALIEVARSKGYRNIFGDVLGKNAKMLRLMHGLGFLVQPHPEESALRRVVKVLHGKWRVRSGRDGRSVIAPARLQRRHGGEARGLGAQHARPDRTRRQPAASKAAISPAPATLRPDQQVHSSFGSGSSAKPWPRRAQARSRAQRDACQPVCERLQGRISGTQFAPALLAGRDRDLPVRDALVGTLGLTRRSTERSACTGWIACTPSSTASAPPSPSCRPTPAPAPARCAAATRVRPQAPRRAERTPPCRAPPGAHRPAAAAVEQHHRLAIAQAQHRSAWWASASGAPPRRPRAGDPESGIIEIIVRL